MASLHVPVNYYGIAEDSHQMLMHVLAQFLAQLRYGLSGRRRAPEPAGPLERLPYSCQPGIARRD